jgi:uncharacterized protein (TIGR03437 family)
MKKMLVCCGLLALSAFSLVAQTAQSIPFLTLMESRNEVPSVPETHTGNVLVWIHVVRDAAGTITSGSVDFDIQTRFAGAVTVTGLHIHTGAAGVNGGIVVPTDVNNSDKSIVIDATGRTRIQKQVQFPSTVAPIVSLATINDILANPQNFYVNIHTTVNGGGAMRGQLMPAEATMLLGQMSTRNEVPPVTANGSAVASVLLLRARSAAGATALATAIFNVDYTGVDAGTTFTGLHIHNGIAGVNGGVIINTGIAGTNTLAADPSGTGNINIPVHMSPLDNNFPAEVATVNSLFVTPQNHYINIHTTQFGGGIMRDQMRTAEAVTFNVNMLPSNEVPPITGLAANAVTAIPTFIIRNPDGTVAGGAVIYDVNYRGFPAGTVFTGLHIHRGAAGANGGIVIQSGVDNAANRITSETGNGNIFKLININTPAALTALSDITANPNAFYANLHTTVNAGGAIREQLTPALGRATIGGVANNASTITTVAPGSVIAIYGTNLSPIFSDLSGFAGLTQLVTSMNGVSVTIGGVRAPFYAVTPNQINVQVPFEVTAGSQPVIVTTSNGASAAFNVTVAAAAPSIFILDAAGTGAVVKNADFSLITANNRARAGDTIVIYSTGLGQTTPAVATGALAAPPAGTFNNTGTVTVTIGGVNAPVVYSIAAPGFAGLYQTAVTVPTGLTGASAPLILRSGTTASNTVNIAIQ